MSRERIDILNAKKVLADVWPGQAQESSVALLKALHILTRDGALNQDARRKLKQVLHLVQLLRPSIEALLAENPDTVIADLGTGKSYLGFILYDLVIGPLGRGNIVGVDVRTELVEKSRLLAKESNFTRMTFVAGEIAGTTLPGRRADMVTALHACDTATDDAIRFALHHEAKVVALIPCCQAEVATLLGASTSPLHQLWRHNTHRREFGAHVTNVIRSLVLEMHGYKVRVTEFTGLEHSLKNELILARKVHADNRAARARLDALLASTGVRPKLVRT